MERFGRGEEGRLAALAGLGILDTPNEPEFDAIVREAAAALDTPIALLSLVDENRQWFKARFGLDVAETPRSMSFCSHAIESDKTLTVSNATQDPRFADNPLVTGDPSIRFYAGVPLTTAGGWRIGTLCVIDKKDRPTLSPQQADQLRLLAERAMAALEARRSRPADSTD